MPKPFVLHVIAGLGIGGAETALLRLVTGSDSRVYKHAVVALTPGGQLERQFRDAGIPVHVLELRSAPLSEFLALVALLRRARPDIVQTWMYHADVLGGLAARLAGIERVIWGVRTSELTANCPRLTRAIRKLGAWLSPVVPQEIVCVAEAARRSHVRIGYSAERMSVIPNGFDMDALTASQDEVALLRAHCGFSDTETVVGTLGRFNFSKDHCNFVQAAGLLARDHDHVRFMMVGRGLCASNAELMSWVAQTGYADRFVLLGERLDAPTCLAAMDIFCLSSRNEGFPNAVGEAMATGRPCVVTNVGDAAVLVADAGLVVPKEDTEALAAGITDVLALDVAARRMLGERAKERIRNEFTEERTRQRYEDLYSRLLATRVTSSRASDLAA